MYVKSGDRTTELKSGRIARVEFSSSGRTPHFDGNRSSPWRVRRASRVRATGSPLAVRTAAIERHVAQRPIEIDEDARVEYWTEVRG
jgi:hypothetical protein